MKQSPVFTAVYHVLYIIYDILYITKSYISQFYLKLSVWESHWLVLSFKQLSIF